MPDTQRPLVPVPFAEAIAWAKARKVVLPDVYYGELQGLARSMAFSIAGLAKLDQLQAVLDSLVANLESGESFGKWQNRVASGEIPLDLPPHRLETIFRTNIQGHYGRGRCEQQKRTTDSHPWYLYDAVNDSRTRPSHAAMDGFMARHDDPVWAKWTPPSGYQSLLPDQPVSGAIEIGLKAWYSGPAVEIVMDSGARVRITAKHPVLTSAGWMDACDLRKGQDLLCYAGEVNDVGATVTSKAQEQHVPLTAEQAFNALSARGVVSVPRAAFNLNGDVEFIQSDVDVVTANRHLMNALQSGVREMIDKFDFKGANAGAVILPGSRSVFAHLFTPNRVIPKRAGIAGGYLRNFAHAFVAKVKNLGAYAIQFDPVRLQVSGQAFSVYVMGSGNGFEGFASQVTANDISRYRAAKLRSGDSGFPGSSNGGRLFSGTLAPSFRDVFVGGFGVNANAACDLIHAHSGLIKTDKVTDLRFFDWTGHVYDFQCSNGLIIAQGGAYNSHSPIISNCRCRRIALTEAQAPRFIEADRKRLEKDPQLAEARAQAEPDKGWDYSPCADPTAGLKRAIEQRRMRCGDGRLAQGRDSPCHERIVSILREMADTATDPAPQLAIRSSWPDGFPAVAIHATESSVKKHPEYAAAKSGDPAASLALVMAVAEDRLVLRLDSYRDKSPLILPVQGMEGVSLNTIPLALGVIMAKRLGYDLATSVVQTTKAGHTGATGWWRLRSPALFSGDVERGRNYLLVDDFVGMGGTYANLRGYIEAKGGVVLGAHALTGKPRSAILSLQSQTLQSLRAKHGTLEPWWRAEFGYGFDALTESEATYLLRAEDADTIRRRLAEAASEGEY